MPLRWQEAHMGKPSVHVAVAFQVPRLAQVPALVPAQVLVLPLACAVCGSRLMKPG